MKRALMMAAIVCVPVAASAAPAGPDRESSVPSVAPLPDREAKSEPKQEKKKKAAPPTIRLDEKCETDQPAWSGAGYIPAGKFKVKAEDGKLTATLIGAAYSHAVLGVPSESVARIQLVQEFDVVEGDSKQPLVELTLTGKLDGYVRSENHGSAYLRVADATITPTEGGPTLWLALPTACASGDSLVRCKRESQAPPLTLHSGHFVLVANLVLETTTNGFLRSHAGAVFVPGKKHPGSWFSPNHPTDSEVEGDDFGFAVTLKAAPPSSH